jgi:hypothetical protein
VVIQHFGGGSGLLFNEIEKGLAENAKGLFWVGCREFERIVD